MDVFIANQIIECAKVGGVTAGQERYRDYFIRVTYCRAFKEGVDTILTLENRKDCIVAE